MLMKLDNKSFENEVYKNGVVLVDFYADWCGPCKKVGPIVEEIAKEREDITVGKVNVDEARGLAEEFRVMSIPTLIVFENGREKKRIVGYVPKAEILKAL